MKERCGVRKHCKTTRSAPKTITFKKVLGPSKVFRPLLIYIYIYTYNIVCMYVHLYISYLHCCHTVQRIVGPGQTFHIPLLGACRTKTKWALTCLMHPRRLCDTCQMVAFSSACLFFLWFKRSQSSGKPTIAGIQWEPGTREDSPEVHPYPRSLRIPACSFKITISSSPRSLRSASNRFKLWFSKDEAEAT